MAAPVIDLYTGDLPLRSNAPTFNTNQEDYLTWEVPMIGQMNTSVDFVNTKADEVVVNLGLTNADVVASAASAAASEVSAQNSAASSNYVGTWAGLTGAQVKGIRVSHDGAFWLLNENVADITTEEPTPTNTKWQFSSGTRWVQPTVLSKNSQSSIEISTPTSKALPAMIANDFIIIKNSKTSTDELTITNSTYTIVGTALTKAPDDFILRPGDTASFMAKSPTVLEAVQ